MRIATLSFAPFFALACVCMGLVLCAPAHEDRRGSVSIRITPNASGSDNGKSLYGFVLCFRFFCVFKVGVRMYNAYASNMR